MNCMDVVSVFEPLEQAAACKPCSHVRCIDIRELISDRLNLAQSHQYSKHSIAAIILIYLSFIDFSFVRSIKGKGGSRASKLQTGQYEPAIGRAFSAASRMLYSWCGTCAHAKGAQSTYRACNSEYRIHPDYTHNHNTLCPDLILLHTHSPHRRYLDSIPVSTSGFGMVYDPIVPARGLCATVPQPIDHAILYTIDSTPQS